MDFYYDGGRQYLELHAKRAPLGPYAGPYSEENDTHGFWYAARVQIAIEDFEREHGVTVYQLGRSGRHICIDDTPDNRERWAALRDAAIDAAASMWADMTTEQED